MLVNCFPSQQWPWEIYVNYIKNVTSYLTLSRRYTLQIQKFIFSSLDKKVEMFLAKTFKPTENLYEYENRLYYINNDNFRCGKLWHKNSSETLFAKMHNIVSELGNKANIIQIIKPDMLIKEEEEEKQISLCRVKNHLGKKQPK